MSSPLIGADLEKLAVTLGGGCATTRFQRLREEEEPLICLHKIALHDPNRKKNCCNAALLHVQCLNFRRLHV